MFIFSVSYAAPQEDLAGVESAYNIAESDMYTMIYINEIADTLQQSCEPTDIAVATQWIQNISDVLDARYASMNQAEVLLHSRDLYEKIASSHDTILDALWDRQYCQVKYIVYFIQQHLRNLHLKILEDTYIIEDFKWFGVAEVYGPEVKYDLLQYFINDLEQYRDKLWHTLSFSVENPSFKDALPADKKNILWYVEEIMQLSLYKALYDLEKAGILDKRDFTILDDVTIFEYNETCSVVNGKYQVKETLTSGGEHIQYDTKWLYLKINMCANFFVLRDLPKIYEKIVVHELGHHVYYYHDHDTHSNFEDICWDGIDTPNGVCTQNDYVSDYARTQAVEDYADHFMFWFLDLIPENMSTPRIEQKNAHFDSLRNK